MVGNRHIKVLLIEDNPGDARLVRESLAEVKYAVFDFEWTNQLSAGLERLREVGFDAILLDLSLPDSRGLDTFIKIHAQVPDIPIIVLTGLDDEEIALNAVRGGAQDYLVKGQIDGNLLARTMRYAIERKRVEEELQSELAVSTALAELSNAMLAPSSSIQDIANIVLDYAKRLTRSEHGYVSSIDPETGDSISHTLTQMMRGDCRVAGEGRRIVFPVGPDGLYHGLWGHALNTRKAFFTNSPDTHAESRGVPEGHIVIENFLSAPAVAAGELVGQIALANSEEDYKERDLEGIKRLADLYALAIQQKMAEERLRDALEESEQRQVEISALLEGSRAVLEYREFQDSARSMFDSCKNVIGAAAGYVAVLSEDGTENEVLFLDAGGLPCNVDPALPMPVRGLRGETYCTGKVVYDNDFARSEWVKFMPEGHARLDSVLFAPLKIDKRVVGLIGLANKPGGFNDEDARLASAFGEFAAIAFRNNRILGSLESSERHFRSVVETAGDAIITADSRGDIVLWNNGAERAFGYSAHEAVSKSATLIIPEQFHEIHQEGMERAISTAEPGIIRGTIEAVGLRKDGTEFPIEISRATWKAKGEMFFTAIIRDITERKEEEARKAAERELEAQRVLSMRSDRLRSLGEMSAGIAHELNQPLVGVRGMSERLLISLDRGWELTEEKMRDMATTIIEQADRMVRIIEHIRIFAREAGKSELRPVHANDVVKSSIDMLGTQLRSRGIQLECDLMDGLPVVMVNPFSLEEVIINLLINARDALEEKEDGSVSEPPQVLLRTMIDYSDSREYVKIEVTDKGTGIPESIIDRVFDPFFSTKGPDRGTGLGLSISKSIIEGFGGRIQIQSICGSGTTVTISLPVEESSSREEG